MPQKQQLALANQTKLNFLTLSACADAKPGRANFFKTPSQIHKALDYCASPSLLHLYSCTFVLMGSDQRIG